MQWSLFFRLLCLVGIFIRLGSSNDPSPSPTPEPSPEPTVAPSPDPSPSPTPEPSPEPTVAPSPDPSPSPTPRPSAEPTVTPTAIPTAQPTPQPSPLPTPSPTGQPSRQPTGQPTGEPTRQPTGRPTGQPSGKPTGQPTDQPSGKPSGQPSRRPSRQPTGQPTEQPSQHPSGQPTGKPSGQPTDQPTGHPTDQPSTHPSGQPTTQPSRRPSRQPTGQPTQKPSGQPSTLPTGQPTTLPTSAPSITKEAWGQEVWDRKRIRGSKLCPNKCSGHGSCLQNNVCKCFVGGVGDPEFFGPDCSQRACPLGAAWISDTLSEEDSLHPRAECSNKGTCNRKTGACLCYPGYDGIACQRTTCPSDCHDRGACYPLRILASKAGRNYSEPWDAMKSVGCLCDAGFRGPSCLQVECPSGPDPLAGFGNEAGRDCSGRGLCDYQRGLCNCFSGFIGERCEIQYMGM